MSGVDDGAELQPGDVLVEMKAAKFARERITVPSGPVSVVVDNADLFWHTFTIDELDVDVRVPVQARAAPSSTPRPAPTHYYCAIPGHRVHRHEGHPDRLALTPDPRFAVTGLQPQWRATAQGCPVRP